MPIYRSLLQPSDPSLENENDRYKARFVNRVINVYVHVYFQQIINKNRGFSKSFLFNSL